MKAEGQIRHKLKQLLFRHMKKRLEAALKIIPSNCVYNCAVKIKTIDGTFKEGDYPRICSHIERAGQVCDLSLSPMSVDAAICPYWVPKKSKQQVKQEFHTFAIQSREVIVQEMPDVATLLWVLEQETSNTVSTINQLKEDS